jgi:hypothetical protein
MPLAFTKTSFMLHSQGGGATTIHAGDLP